MSKSKSIQGGGLIKLQLHPGTDMAQATAETVGYVDRALMPTGTVPPFVMRFDGGSVPVGDLVFSSKTKTVAELQDAALFKVRPLFSTLPGVSRRRRHLSMNVRPLVGPLGFGKADRRAASGAKRPFTRRRVSDLGMSNLSLFDAVNGGAAQPRIC
jgi:hypothetical protein